LSGILLGGTSPDNDITITVTTLSFDSTQSITNFTYTGVGQDNGYTHKSLEESNNVVSNFITSVETVWPVYTSSNVQEITVPTIDSPQATLDNPNITLDQG
jgi:hypothetical protein